MAWANGRGITDEVMAVPNPAAWDWRLSIAEVNEDGPFSSLPEVDRALVVADGAGMTLFVNGVANGVRRFDQVRFSGDDDTRAELLDGPVRDLNLMVRCSSGLGAPLIDVIHVAAGSECSLGDAVAAIVLDGWMTIEGGPDVLAERFDAFIPEVGDSADSLVLTAFTTSVVALARLRH
jgi:environmental stress-induced protein Ves